MTLAVNIAQGGANNVSFRNRIINGAMVIDQRNAGASTTVAANGYYSCDRWKTYTNPASKYAIQQNAGSVTPPIGFSNYLGITSSSAYSVGSGDYFWLEQNIEGYNIADLGWGTANAKTVTLSFQVYSSLTGQFGGSIANAGRARTYPFSYTISSANTWTTISITVAGDTSGTWAKDNTTGMSILFDLGSGSSLLGTSGAWNSAGNVGSTGDTKIVATSGATFYITGVQLEAGTTASPFEYRPYGTELQLAKRYYSQGTTVPTYNGTALSVTMPTFVFYGQSMRISPTVTVANGGIGYGYPEGVGIVSAAPIAAGTYYQPGAFTATAEL
jgi:hypothetical protein